MLPVLGLLLAAPTAEASSNISFKVSGPVAIFVDGKKATLTGKLEQTVTGLEPGTHRIRVAGVFGKTLFEADMEVPDNTMTWAEWDAGTLRVLRTEWLEERPVQAAPDRDMAVAEPEPEPEPEPAPPPAPEPEPEPEVAAAPPAPAAPTPPTPAATPPVVVAPVGSGVVVDGDAAGVISATPTVEEGPATLGAEPKWLTVEATEGTMVEIKANGRSVYVLVEGEVFRVSDASGLELALKKRTTE